MLGRGRRETVEPGQLALRLAPGLLAQAGLLDPAAELGDPAGAVVLLAELTLDGPELLAQVKLALLLGELLLGVGRDLSTQLAHRDLALKYVDQAAQLVGNGRQLEQLLACGRVHGHDRRDEVHHVSGIAEVLGGDRHIVGQLRGGLHEPAEDADHRATQTVDLRGLDRRLPGGLDPRHQIGLGPDPLQQPDSLDALDHHAHAAVGHPRELIDDGRGAHPVKVIGRVRHQRQAAQRRQRQEPVAAHDVVHETDGARLGHGEGDRRQREDDRVPQRQDRERVGDREFLGAAGGLDRHHGMSARLGNVMRSRPRS